MWVNIPETVHSMTNVYMPRIVMDDLSIYLMVLAFENQLDIITILLHGGYINK